MGMGKGMGKGMGGGGAGQRGNVHHSSERGREDYSGLLSRVVSVQGRLVHQRGVVARASTGLDRSGSALH